VQLSTPSTKATDRNGISAPSVGNKSPKRRRPVAPFDRRLRLGRRVSEFERVFISIIGDAAKDNPILRAAIRRAAELKALAESLRSRALRGDDVSADDIVRVERLSAAAERALKLDQCEREKSDPPSLADYLKHAAAEDEKANAA
jgi:hypothetical protein